MNLALYRGLICCLVGLCACSSPANKRAIDIKDLKKVQAAEAQNAPPEPARDALTAAELIALAECRNLDCVQFFMKNLSDDFVHATKGEFAALHRSLVIDTSGKELIIPLSTLYVDINPQASWRLAHTLHRKEMSNRLLDEFQRLGFVLVDSGYNRNIKGVRARFTSLQYPGKVLYTSHTYQPWYWKGLYKYVTWPCFVFEVYNIRQ
ncbi:hypothetical protein D3H65_21240 [Paraflavitalea soli]|uniref:Lipoprotein n=1 Tax=Paraflavitalea soli TaxID=2315862 RepID=A0A3B7MPD5_9BACT|nr:hypothetical protein [Paraflavitalea soli]AXY76364.1 hypothetical protein D3H65_21240 [Paraflavitalea soli]